MEYSNKFLFKQFLFLPRNKMMPVTANLIKGLGLI